MLMFLKKKEIDDTIYRFDLSNLTIGYRQGVDMNDSYKKLNVYIEARK